MTPVIEESEVDLKKKLFYKINEVSRITNLKPYVLRYWETEFPQLSPEKDENDQRRYRRKDIELILRIKKLLYEEKFTIAGAKQRIAAELGGGRRGRAPEAEPSGLGEERSEAPLTHRVKSPKALPRILSEIATIRSELRDLIAYLG